MAGFIELKCPRCLSSSCAPIDPLHYRCAHCQTVFLRDAPPPRQDAPPVPPPVPYYAPPQASSHGPLLALAAIAVLTLLLMGAGAAFFLAHRPAPRGVPAAGRPVQPVSVVETPAVPAVATPVPRAQLDAVRQGKSLTSPFWLATYKNVGTVPIARPAARVSLFDASGHRVGEQSGYGKVSTLGPGQSTPILVLYMQAPTFARADVKPIDPEAPTYDDGEVPVSITEQSVAPPVYGQVAVVGTVKNSTAGTVKFVHVVVEGVDGAGAIVSLADGYATTTTLGAGAASGFNVSTGTFQVEVPAKYRVFAVARAEH